MKVLVVSDTHGRNTKFEQAVEKEKPFDYLIHCGDVESNPLSIASTAGCLCTMVAGNNDFFLDLPKEARISLMGHKIFVCHGHHHRVSMGIFGIEDACRSRDCRIALFGHTHRPLIQEENGILFVNPGSLTFPRQEGRRPSYAVLELFEDKMPTAEIRYLW